MSSVEMDFRGRRPPQTAASTKSHISSQAIISLSLSLGGRRKMTDWCLDVTKQLGRTTRGELVCLFDFRVPHSPRVLELCEEPEYPEKTHETQQTPQSHALSWKGNWRNLLWGNESKKNNHNQKFKLKKYAPTEHSLVYFCQLQEFNKSQKQCNPPTHTHTLRKESTTISTIQAAATCC